MLPRNNNSLMERIETTILRNLVFNEDYSRKVIPFIQPDYFEQKTEKVIFEEIVQFIVKYGSAITIEALNIEVENRTDLTEDQIKEIREINKSLNDSVVDKQWLLDTTEKWCRDRAIYLALMESIHIADGNNEKKNRDAIPSILSDALAVSFDNNIGHDYLQNYEERYEFYHRKEDKIEFDLEYFNWLAPSCYRAGPYSISLLKWRKRELQKELMQTFSMFRFSNWLIYHARCLRTKSQTSQRKRKELL